MSELSQGSAGWVDDAHYVAIKLRKVGLVSHKYGTSSRRRCTYVSGPHTSQVTPTHVDEVSCR